MKWLRLEAACAVALMLLSLMVNAAAYGNGNGRLLARMYERTIGEAAKMPQRFMESALPQKLVKGAAVLAVLCGTYICGTDDVSVAEPQRIERTAEASRDDEVVVVAGKRVNMLDLNVIIEQLEIIERVENGNLTLKGLESEPLFQTKFTSPTGKDATLYKLLGSNEVMVKVGDQGRVFAYTSLKEALWYANRATYGGRYGGLMSPLKAENISLFMTLALIISGTASSIIYPHRVGLEQFKMHIMLTIAGSQHVAAIGVLLFLPSILSG